MSNTPSLEPENEIYVEESVNYRHFLQRKVDAARLSHHHEQGLSNEEIEVEFAARRAQGAE